MDNLTIKLQNQRPLNISLQKNDPLNIKLISQLGGNGKIHMDTTENWNLKITYIPPAGDIIIYSDKVIINGVAYPGIKVGDGNAYLIDLPFVGDDVTISLLSELEDHINNHIMHVTEEEKSFWDNKLNYELIGEELVFNNL